MSYCYYLIFLCAYIFLFLKQVVENKIHEFVVANQSIKVNKLKVQDEIAFLIGLRPRGHSQFTFTNFHTFLTTHLSSFTIFMLQTFTNFPDF